MAIVTFGDLHLEESKSFSTILPNGINSRLVEQMKVVGRIADQLRPTDTVVFLGDLINSYGESLKKIIYSAAFYTLKTWASKCEQLYVLVGNHDIYRNATIVHAFDEIDNVKVIEGWETVEIDNYIVDLVSWNSSLPGTKGDIFCGHVMPIGAWLGKLYVKQAEEGVPIEWFDGYKYVFCGHVHEPQDLVVPRSETIVHCPGSIIQLNLSSSPAPRYLWRLEHGKISKIEIPSPKIYTTVLNTQAEVDKFFSAKVDGYHKILATDNTLQFPTLDHTLTVEFVAKPEAGEQIEEIKEMNLLEIIHEFIDGSKTSIDKAMAKELITKLY
jgi:DNA repair exonuclease SbcCD nuclease subunit